jgi:signal transduction histidine kinase/ActR/RegA family two-component response regulator
MDRRDSVEKALHHQIARLGQELEQAHVALEDAQAEAAALAVEQDQLRHRVRALDRARAIAEHQATIFRNQAAQASAGYPNDRGKHLQSALEEASVLAEELKASNEELMLANEQLDQRVAERTTALDRAYAEMEAVNADLHRRVEAEAVARTKAQADLFQLQKLEAIGQLTGGIAHDFNNLLMVIVNGLQVLAQTNDPHQHKRALRRTQEASWRAAELTRRLQAFARRQALYPQRIELQQHIVSLRDLLFQGLNDDIRLHNDIAADIWPIEADVVALELALLNLAVNARDAMPDGGTLTIAARNVPVEPAMAASRQLALGDYVEISVSDTGIGMAPELVAKAFEPFFTTKGAGNGAGLGLSQVHGFANQSGGTAWVQSSPNEGTTVRLLLPRSQRELKPYLPSGPSQSSKTNARLEVLVVEDDTSVASVVLEMIAALGHRGTCVPTVAAALTLLNNASRIDLVLSDVLLPGGGSGLDLARELRQRCLGVPIILTSGYGGEMTQRLSAMNLPFLRKPYQSDALANAISVALSAGGAAGEA